MKFTPPGRDMNVWTIIWAFMGMMGLFWGIKDGNVKTILLGLFLIGSSAAIWLGFSVAKWLFVAFFCLGIMGRIDTMVSGNINSSIIASTILFAVLAVRFFQWSPPARQETDSAKPAD